MRLGAFSRAVMYAPQEPPSDIGSGTLRHQFRSACAWRPVAMPLLSVVDMRLLLFIPLLLFSVPSAFLFMVPSVLTAGWLCIVESVL